MNERAAKDRNKNLEPLNNYDLVQLGHFPGISHAPQTTYLNYSLQKDSGVYRIGIFGCSFVYGSEAPYGHDFPTQLLQKYHAEGNEKVEIINFGVPGYGMNQSFYMWNQLAHRYNLDVTIFNVLHYHLNRDNTFITSYNTYGPIHARYILDNGEISFIPVIGNSNLAASEAYFSPIQHSEYLRYDIKTPVPLQAIMPGDRQLSSNPFYYYPEPEEEWKYLYAAIFDSVASASKRLVLMIGDKHIGSFLPKMKADDISYYYPYAYTIQDENRSIYTAFRSHPSSLGYQVLAKELYSWLEDSNQVYLPLIENEFISDTTITFDKTWGAIKQMKRCYIGMNGKELSVFVNAKAGKTQMNIFNFEGTKIQALLALNSKKEQVFIPISHPLSESNQLKISYRLNGKKQEIFLGHLKGLSPFLANWKAFSFRDSLNSLDMKFIFGANAQFYISKNTGISDLTVYLNDRPILKGKVGENKLLDLEPVTGKYLWMRGSHDQIVDVNLLSPRGSIDFMAEYKNGESVRLPFMSYRIKEVAQGEELAN